MDILWLYENKKNLILDDSVILKIEQICKLYFTFQEKKNKYNNNYINTWMNQFSGMQNILSSKKTITDQDNKISIFPEDDLEQFFTNYIDSFLSLDSLEILKSTDRNVVVVGANGSGKTTFLKHLMDNNKDIGISYYPSERLFLTVASEKYSLRSDVFYQSFENNRSAMLDSTNANRSHYFSKDFDFSIALLINRHNQEMQSGILNTNTTAHKILNKWNELIKTRKLIIENNQIFGVYRNDKYSVDNISSGEKSILYFLINILLRNRSNYYIIDEPENSLNSSIVSQLWTFIEEEKRDSIFVYLTHDSNFVVSRNNSEKYWMKGYLGFNKWDIIELPVNDYLPEELIVQLIGTKQPVIFVESEDNSKFDYKLYSLMFPEFKVIPTGGSDQVKFRTKAYNSLKLIKAYGIIDCDYYDDEYLKGQEKHNIFYAPFFEVENLLVSEEIVTSVINYHIHEEDKKALAERKNALLKDLVDNLKDKSSKIINRMTHFRVLKNIKETSFDAKIQVEDIKSQILELGKIDVDSIYHENEEIIKNIINQPNHNLILRYLDDKNNILKRVERFTEMKYYESNILRYLQLRDKNILALLRKKYFPKIV